MANVLGIPSPKEDIDGCMVGEVYYEEGDLDVITLAKVFLRLGNEHLLREDEIIHI